MSIEYVQMKILILILNTYKISFNPIKLDIYELKGS